MNINDPRVLKLLKDRANTRAVLAAQYIAALDHAHAERVARVRAEAPTQQATEHAAVLTQGELMAYAKTISIAEGVATKIVDGRVLARVDGRWERR